MYILFKMKDKKELGAVQIYGRWLGYCVGFIPDTHKDIIPYLHLDPTILTDTVAKAWLLTQGWKGHVSIRPGTLEDDQMGLHESSEPTGEKEKYTLTTDDIANCTAFMKAVLRKHLDEIYDHRLQALNINVSALESSTWEKQKSDYIKYTNNNSANVPLLDALATSRGIEKADMAVLIRQAINNYDEKVRTLLASKQVVETEIKNCADISACFVLMHQRFEMTMPVALQTSTGTTTAAQFNV
jgi:hypothetical protein